jgi:hypothetical protein
MFRHTRTSFRLLNPSSRPRSLRQLSLENLESRAYLSGLTEISSTAVDLPVAIPVAVLSEPPSQAPSLDATPNGSAQMPISKADVAVAELASSGPAVVGVGAANVVTGPVAGASVGAGVLSGSALLSPTGLPGGPGPLLMPPWIANFTATRDGDYWHFQGEVMDDKSVAGLTVYFTGATTGQTTTNANGAFSFTVLASQVIGSWVSAHTVDTDKLVSDYETVSTN